MNESAAEEKEEQKEKLVPLSQQQQPPPLLKTLQSILHNRIIQKNLEMHKTHNRAYTDNLWGDKNTTLSVSAYTDS